MTNPGNASIHTAVMEHSLLEVIKAISSGENVDALDRETRTPFFYAAKDGDDESRKLPPHTLRRIH
jgi:hypothetical protein